jgi:hypothetical protein
MASNGLLTLFLDKLAALEREGGLTAEQAAFVAGIAARTQRGVHLGLSRQQAEAARSMAERADAGRSLAEPSPQAGG